MKTSTCSKRIPLLLLLGVSLHSASAALVNLGANGGASTASQSTTQASFVASRGIDGSTGNFTHTLSSSGDTSPNWTVDLGVTTVIDSVTIWNRVDCCGGRLSDIDIEVLDFNDNVVATVASDFNDGNSLAPSPGNQNSSPGSPLDFNAGGVIGRKVRISRNSLVHSPTVLSLAEVQVFSQNAALDALANGGSIANTVGGDLNSTLYPASAAIDGNLGNFTHTGSTAAGGTLLLDLGETINVDSLILHNRDSCCQGRLQDITVDILGADGSTVLWSSPLLNPGNTLGGPATLNLDLWELTGGFVSGGRYVQVTNNSANYLSLGELQVFGVPEPSRAVLIGLGAIALLARRRR